MTNRDGLTLTRDMADQRKKHVTKARAEKKHCILGYSTPKTSLTNWLSGLNIRGFSIASVVKTAR